MRMLMGSRRRPGWRLASWLAVAVVALGGAAFGGPAPGGPALAAGTTLAVEAPNSTVAPGQSFQANVTVSGAADLYGFAITVSFDPKAFEVTEAGKGSFFPGQLIGNTINNEIGQVTLIGTMLGQVPGASGSGLLATLTVRRKAAGSGSITLAGAQLANSRAERIAANLTGGLAPANGGSGGTSGASGTGGGVSSGGGAGSAPAGSAPANPATTATPGTGSGAGGGAALPATTGGAPASAPVTGPSSGFPVAVIPLAVIFLGSAIYFGYRIARGKSLF